MPSLEDMWIDEVTVSHRRPHIADGTLEQEVAMLRQNLSTALAMLEVMQEELQMAHDALSAMQPPASLRCARR